MPPVTVLEGEGSIILGQPHSGLFVPREADVALNQLGLQLLDTDWHIPQLYDGLLEGSTTVRANFSRYVIDPNRDPDGTSLYPGQNTTELVPTRSFDGKPIWENEPDEAEIARRIAEFHRPYHTALKAQIERVKAKHGFAVLYDCHSIRSRIPHLFDDRLPDLNIGDNSGMSCAPAITEAVAAQCKLGGDFSSVINGRFKGGWTTRHYGSPQDGVYAIQMEIAQRTYLESEVPPFAYASDKADTLREVLANVLQAISDTVNSSEFLANVQENQRG